MPTATPALTNLARLCSSASFLSFSAIASSSGASLWRRGDQWKLAADAPPVPTFPGARGRSGRSREPAHCRRRHGIGGYGEDAGADRPRLDVAPRRSGARDDPVPDLHQGRGGGDGEPYWVETRGLGQVA